jgi:hypothetical protein
MTVGMDSSIPSGTLLLLSRKRSKSGMSTPLTQVLDLTRLTTCKDGGLGLVPARCSLGVPRLIDMDSSLLHVCILSDDWVNV